MCGYNKIVGGFIGGYPNFWQCWRGTHGREGPAGESGHPTPPGGREAVEVRSPPPALKQSMRERRKALKTLNKFVF